jgi:hypothetical protein
MDRHRDEGPAMLVSVGDSVMIRSFLPRGGRGPDKAAIVVAPYDTLDEVRRYLRDHTLANALRSASGGV